MNAIQMIQIVIRNKIILFHGTTDNQVLVCVWLLLKKELILEICKYHKHLLLDKQFLHGCKLIKYQVFLFFTFYFFFCFERKCFNERDRACNHSCFVCIINIFLYQKKKNIHTDGYRECDGSNLIRGQPLTQITGSRYGTWFGKFFFCVYLFFFVILLFLGKVLL